MLETIDTIMPSMNPPVLDELLTLAAVALIGAAWFGIRGWYRRRALLRGRILVESVLVHRGISTDQLSAENIGHALDEARARCSGCALQGDCLRTVAGQGADPPAPCPNQSLFEHLDGRARPATMRRFRLDRLTSGRR